MWPRQGCSERRRFARIERRKFIAQSVAEAFEFGKLRASPPPRRVGELQHLTQHFAFRFGGSNGRDR